MMPKEQKQPQQQPVKKVKLGRNKVTTLIIVAAIVGGGVGLWVIDTMGPSYTLRLSPTENATYAYTALTDIATYVYGTERRDTMVFNGQIVVSDVGSDYIVFNVTIDNIENIETAATLENVENLENMGLPYLASIVVDRNTGTISDILWSYPEGFLFWPLPVIEMPNRPVRLPSLFSSDKWTTSKSIPILDLGTVTVELTGQLVDVSDTEYKVKISTTITGLDIEGVTYDISGNATLDRNTCLVKSLDMSMTVSVTGVSVVATTTFTLHGL